MELTVIISSIPPSLQDHQSAIKNRISIQKTAHVSSSISLENQLCLLLPCRTHFRNSLQQYQTMPHCQNHTSIRKADAFLQISRTHLSSCPQNHISVYQTASFLEILIAHVSDRIRNHFPIINHGLAFSLLSFSIPCPSLAAETTLPAEQISDRIDLESILISIDNFFNRYPFFVASITFIWLVVIPLTQAYLKKYKFTSALDAFRKLRDDPNAVLLDIRSPRSMAYIASPNLKFLKKTAIQIEYSEGEEDGFVKEVLKNFNDQGNTTICVLDNFDGNSLKVAELLVSNGFKEAYAIKGGLRGKDGWQEIQENFLPPSLHVYPRKKGKGSQKHYVQEDKTGSTEEENGKILNSKIVDPDAERKAENGSVKPAETIPQASLNLKRPLSPYPNYPDFKPPASPSPSKPQK